MAKPLVFSFMKEQRTFLMSLMGLLSFLAVLCLGLVISLGTAVNRWGMQWDLMATVQVLPGPSAQSGAEIVTKILDNMRGDIAEMREISTEDATRMLRPWLSGGDALTGYIPKMTEVKFKSRTALRTARDKIIGIQNVRFVSHSDGMRASTSAGWKIIMLSVLVLGLVLGAVVLCISYITRNITLIHRRELEILNQVGARDGFIARQLMIIIARITTVAVALGFAVALPVLLFIISMARSFRIGMFTQMAVPGAGWAALFLLAVGITVLAIWTARRTVLGILRR